MSLDVLRDWCGPMTRRWLKNDVDRWDELARDEQHVRFMFAVLIAISEFAGLLVATVALGVAVFGVQGINGVTVTVALMVVVPLAWGWLRL